MKQNGTFICAYVQLTSSGTILRQLFLCIPSHFLPQVLAAHTVVAVEARETAHASCFMHSRQILHKFTEVISMLAQFKNPSKHRIHCVMYSTVWRRKRAKVFCSHFAKYTAKVSGCRWKCKNSHHSHVNIRCIVCNCSNALHCSPTLLLCNTFHYFIFSNIYPNA